MDNKQIAQQAAGFQRDAKRHFDTAVTALIALAWDKRKQGFSYGNDDEMYAEAMSVCMELTDACMASAKQRAQALTATLEHVDDDVAWNGIAEDAEESFDMAGSHLISLLEVWIGVAVANEWSQEYTLQMIKTYVNNPYASPGWEGVPRVLLKWGRGYDKNVLKQLTKIGQDAIIGGARFGEWLDEVAMGATYYIRRRGSTYDCPACDDLCGYPIPIAEPFDYVHSRCMCYPEYHYEPYNY